MQIGERVPIRPAIAAWVASLSEATLAVIGLDGNGYEQPVRMSCENRYGFSGTVT